MKIDDSKLRSLFKAICYKHKLDYYEFIRPSKSPQYVKVRSIFIYCLKYYGLKTEEISLIIPLDITNIRRNYHKANQKFLLTTSGLRIKRNIEVLIFRQAIGVETIFNQLMRERVTSSIKTQQRAFMGQIEK